MRGRAPVPTAGPPDIAFTPVALPDGAVPEVLAADGDQLLVGVHRAAAPRRRGWSGAARTARSPRSRPRPSPATAARRPGTRWPPTAPDPAIGGDRGGAHGNVRWSVWTGSASGVAEHAQAFSTFGGWGAGDLIDAVLTPGGSAVVGSWESAEAGLDVAVWTPEGDDWVRRPSTGTPLQSTRAEVASPTAATGFGPGVVVAGWRSATGAGGGQVPVVWRSGPGRRRVGQGRATGRGQGGHGEGDPLRERDLCGGGHGGRRAGAVAPRRRPLEPRPGPPADPGRRRRPARRPARRGRVAHRGRRRPGPGEGRRGGRRRRRTTRRAPPARSPQRCA